MRLLPVVLLTVLGCGKKGDAPATTKEGPALVKDREPSAAVAAAWRKAGGHYGGMRMTRFGSLSLMPYDEPGAADRRDSLSADELPAFGFNEVPAGRLAELPAVGVPFGLLFEKMTDDGLKKLVGLRQLKRLALLGSELTDAGLKELAKLSELEALDLGNNQLTDAGLKELAVLPHLQALYVRSRKMTDTGLAALSGLKELRWLGMLGAGI